MFVCSSEMFDFDTFVSCHRNQLETAGVPVCLWPTLFNKLQNNIFDAGNVFTVIKIEYTDENEITVDDKNEITVEITEEKLEEAVQAIKPLTHGWKVIVSKEDGIKYSDPNQIYLIDHAWTYYVKNARQNLQENHKLLKRMSTLMDIEEEYSLEILVDIVLKEMWRYNQSYSISGLVMEGDDVSSIWYIMDEFGSRIQHCDDPSFRVVPFYYLFAGIIFSIMFPIKNLNYGDEVTRDYVEGPPRDKLTQKALKIPWVFTDMTDIDCQPVEPSVEYFTSGRVQESLPDLEVDFPPIPDDEKLKVFSSYQVIIHNLKHPRFEITSNEEEADILWYDYHFKEYRQLSHACPHKFVNQFPFEHILTVKDLFASVCQRAADTIINLDTLESSPLWLPTTFNLKTELPKFVSYFQQREKRGLDNYWICKPWNLARGLDMHITDNLNYILRLPSTGPKIACKYISDPVLFPRDDVGLVKFDIRYIILLRSVHPLQLYAYRHFWLRFANKPYSLDCFDDYEKHFTVMNYRPTVLQQMFCDKFIEKFESYYSFIKWSTIESEIFASLRKVFECALFKMPPLGIAESPQSRAMYAIDLMLEWKRDNDKSSMHPVFLEINWAPDCNRACQYYPHFFNDVFSVLFLDETVDKNVILL